MLSIYGSLVVLSFVNPIALDNIGWRYYIVFCVLLVFIVATTYFYFPETRGHSLEEIAEIFDGERAALRQASVVPTGKGVYGDDEEVVGEGKSGNSSSVGEVEHIPRTTEKTG